jgi:hypothetical protein
MSVIVHNYGGAASDLVFAEIELTGGLQLEREDPAQTPRRLLTPAVLAPDNEGSATLEVTIAGFEGR